MLQGGSRIVLCTIYDIFAGLDLSLHGNCTASHSSSLGSKLYKTYAYKARSALQDLCSFIDICVWYVSWVAQLRLPACSLNPVEISRLALEGK